jgi:DNA-binding transcriptional LysR family regulator
LKDHGVSADYVMEFDNIETVKRAVEIDSGIAIVPQETIRQEVANQTLAAIKIEDSDFFRPIAVIHKKNKVLSPAIKQFIALLKETL